MRALVTGGAGFIGSHLVDRLISIGWRVDVIDDLSTGKRDNMPSGVSTNFDFFHGPVYEKSPWQNDAALKADVIFHLAATVGVQRVMENPIFASAGNVNTTFNIMTLAQRYKKPILIASSSEVYGRRGPEPLTEDMDLHIGPELRWGYAAGKLFDEFSALAHHKQSGLPVVVARLFNTIGPRQVGTYGMVVPRMIQAALDHKPIEVYGSGAQRRSFAWVEQTVMQLESLIQNPGAYGQVVNVGSEEDTSIHSLAIHIQNTVRIQSGYFAEIHKISPDRSWNEIYYRKPSVERLSALCGGKMTPMPIDIMISNLVRLELAKRGLPNQVFVCTT